MSKAITIKTNFPVKIRDLNSYIKQLSGAGARSYLVEAMHMALQTVANTAVQDFMIPTKGAAEGIAFDTDPRQLTVRTGRLAASIIGAFRFSSTRLPSTMEKFMKGQFKSSGEGFGSGKAESIREAKFEGSSLVGRIGSKVPYAAIHEYGGKITWKTKSGSAIIPERPYLNPAARASRDEIINIFRAVVVETFKRKNI